MDVTKPYKFIGFGAMDVTKSYEFIWFGAMDVTKPYEFIGFGAMDVGKPYEFIGFGATDVARPDSAIAMLAWPAVGVRLGLSIREARAGSSERPGACAQLCQRPIKINKILFYIYIYIYISRAPPATITSSETHRGRNAPCLW